MRGLNNFNHSHREHAIKAKTHHSYKGRTDNIASSDSLQNRDSEKPLFEAKYIGYKYWLKREKVKRLPQMVGE
jgi:hypothetical protein